MEKGGGEDDRLHKAAHRGDLSMVSFFCDIENLPVNATDKFGSTPLYYAAHGGHKECCKKLLESGAICNSGTYQGERVFYAALNDKLRQLLRDYQVVASYKHPFRQFMSSLLRDASLLSEIEGDADDTGQEVNRGDMSFLVEGQILVAHRAILAARSPYFHGKFVEEWQQKKCVRVTHKKITLVAFEALLEWIYTGSVEIGSGHIGAFRMLAKQFCLDPLLSLIDNYGDVKGNAQDGAPSGRMVKGQLILDEGNFQYLQAYSKWADLVLQNHSIGGDVLIKMPCSCNVASSDAKSPSKGLYLHRAILLPQSPFFDALLSFNGKFRESEIVRQGDVPIDLGVANMHVFRTVVRFLYSGQIYCGGGGGGEGQNDAEDNRLNRNAHFLCALLEVADRFVLPRLKALCASALLPLVRSGCNREQTEEEEQEEEDLKEVTDIYITAVDALEVAVAFDLEKLESRGLTVLASSSRSVFAETMGNERFHKLVIESAWSIQNRQAADSIPIVDNLRYTIREVFDINIYVGYQKRAAERQWRLRQVDSCLDCLNLNTATGANMGVDVGVVAVRK